VLDNDTNRLGGQKGVRQIELTQLTQVVQQRGDARVGDLLAFAELQQLQRCQQCQVRQAIVADESAASEQQVAQLRHGVADAAQARIGQTQAAAQIQLPQVAQWPPVLDALIGDLVAVGDRQHMQLAQLAQMARPDVADLAPTDVQLLELRQVA
jgi:predicted transcriptional regulator